MAIFEGVRIADLTIITAGAVATHLLADLGAEVIKVESRAHPDPFRKWTSAGGEGAAGAVQRSSPTFEVVNRNKLGLELDLKSPAGRETFLSLVERSDAVTENFRGGVMERLGLGYEVLREVNPRLVLLSLGSQGAGGAESGYRSFGSTLEALSGLMSITGYPDSGPVWSSSEVNYPDQVAAVFGAGLLMAGLRHARIHGVGMHLDVSQRELVSAMLGEHLLAFGRDRGSAPARRGNADPALLLNECFACAGEDEWLAITAHDEQDWRTLCSVIDRADLATFLPVPGEECTRDVRQAIEAWSRGRTKHEAMRELQSAGIAAFAVQTGADLLVDPQLAALGHYAPRDRRLASVTLRKAPYRLSEDGPSITGSAPELGHDTRHVLEDILGLTAEEIEALHVDGAIS